MTTAQSQRQADVQPAAAEHRKHRDLYLPGDVTSLRGLKESMALEQATLMKLAEPLRRIERACGTDKDRLRPV